MKLIGRVVLIVVGVLYLISAVSSILGMVENGFNGNIILVIFYLVAAVTAILCGVFGKVNFKLMIFAIILLIVAIIGLVTAIISAVNGNSTWQDFVSSILALLLPFGYYLGYKWSKK